MSRSITSSLMGSLLVGLTLAGCAAAPSPTRTTEESASSATSTPSEPSPAVASGEDPADPSTWVIDEDGVGPIDVGGDFATTVSSLPETWSNDPQSCSWSAWWTAPDSTFGMNFVRDSESDSAPIYEVAVSTTVENGGVAGAPRTAEGLGLGATEQEVLAAYPDAERGTGVVGATTWLRLPSNGESHVFFEFREGASNASSVYVSDQEAPSYEVCG